MTDMPLRFLITQQAYDALVKIPYGHGTSYEYVRADEVDKLIKKAQERGYHSGRIEEFIELHMTHD